MSERPNIVLICADQWRGDCLSIEGHPVVHTPFLDQMSLEGARFTHAYAACPTCIPSRAALYTGLSQRTNGRVGYMDGVQWYYPVTIASEFTRHGYQTQAIGKMHVYPERSQVGFQNIILHDGFLHGSRHHNRKIEMVDDYIPWLRREFGSEAHYNDHGLNPNSYVARPWDKPEHLHPTNFIVTKSIEFLHQRDTTKPFFLFMSFRAPHPPYDPPAWAFEQYLSRNMPDVPVGDWWEAIFGEYANPDQPDCLVGEIRPHLLQRARAGYYGHMTHIDHQLNRFFEVLTEFGLSENTYLCFLSDHGEMMGDHHLFRKGFGYEGSARIPMILKGPSYSDIKQNSTLDEIVELRDVMPTLLDCSGLPIPESLEGQSFLPIMQGKQIDWRDHIHGEHVLFFMRCKMTFVLGAEYDDVDTSQHWVTDGHEKYCWFSGSGHEQLFNLDDDPQELIDLEKETSVAARLDYWRHILIDELTGREEGFTDGNRLIPGQRVHPCLSHLRQRVGIDPRAKSSSMYIPPSAKG